MTSRGICGKPVSTREWRFYFTIAGDVYRIEDIIPHPKK
jgi:hypothetical protein